MHVSGETLYAMASFISSAAVSTATMRGASAEAAACSMAARQSTFTTSSGVPDATMSTSRSHERTMAAS